MQSDFKSLDTKLTGHLIRIDKIESFIYPDKSCETIDDISSNKNTQSSDKKSLEDTDNSVFYS